jgi:hypothetical protein
MHALIWLPPFQPIIGHYWALNHVPFGHDARTAEADAPWHPETSLALNISGTYPRFRVDWWILDYADHRALGVVLMTLMLAAAAASGVFWWNTMRRGRGAASMIAARAPPLITTKDEPIP